MAKTLPGPCHKPKLGEDREQGRPGVGDRVIDGKGTAGSLLSRILLVCPPAVARDKSCSPLSLSVPIHEVGHLRMWSAWVNMVSSLSHGELPGQKLAFLLHPHHPLPRAPSPGLGPTLCRENVRTQNVASSMVSSRVTWMKP